MKHPDLLRTLTLAQKAALLSGRDVWTTYPVPSAGIPSMVLSDGPHGVRRQLGAADHMGVNASQPATCFPTAAALANSWDPELTFQVGRAIGEEAVCQQVNVLLGPGVNVKRSPLGGRGFEYYSEDPYLTGKLAAGFVRGVQSWGIAACPKHFAANSQELLRLSMDSVVDQRTLRELYLTAFEILVKESAPKALMSSYNRLNGIYTNDSRWLLTQILREEWGFDGFVVTDWGGSNDHAAGVQAGSNLEMPGTMGDSDKELFAALEAGRLSHQILDQRVDELLDGVLSTHQAAAAGPKTFDLNEHHALARKAAAQTTVLLKNQGDLLPLPPGTRVALIGDLAFHPRYQGAGSSMVHPTKLDRPLDAWADSGITLVGTARGYRRDGKDNRALQVQAEAMARRADVAVLYLGLPEFTESEGMDRTSLRLPACQNRLVETLAAVNPNLIVILAGGGPVELPWLDRCRALAAVYLPGQAGAGGVVDILTGRCCPSAKLAESWPISLSDTPTASYFPGRQRTAEYREGLYVGYRYYQTVGRPVRFPFGFGLSYTHFLYSDLTLSPQGASFTLTNSGSRPGAEIAQLYVSLPQARVFRPKLELKGFLKVPLSPGESRRVAIPFDDKTFRYFNPTTDQWEIEGGAYLIQIGASAEDLRLSGTLEHPGTGAPCPYDPAAMFSYYSGLIQAVSDREFQLLLGRPIPHARWDPAAPLGVNDTLAQLSTAKNPGVRLAGMVLDHMEQRGLRRGRPPQTILFIRNMPFRALAKMSNGAVTMDMAHSLTELANGHFLSGLGKTARGFFSSRPAIRSRRKNGIDHL